jgi:hypothetical protein
LQFDLVAVSGANEYTVKPLALVSTFAPPIVADFRAVVDAAAGEEAALGELLALLAVLVLAGDEVPHAAAIRATPARPAGTNHRLFITYPLRKEELSMFQHVTGLESVHRGTSRRSRLNRAARPGRDLP